MKLSLFLPLLCVIASSRSLKHNKDTKLLHKLQRSLFIKPYIPYKRSYTSRYLTKQSPRNFHRTYSISTKFTSIANLFNSKNRFGFSRRESAIKRAKDSLGKYVTSKTISAILSTVCTQASTKLGALVDIIKLLHLKSLNYSLFNLMSLNNDPIQVLVKLNYFLFVCDFLLGGSIFNLFKLDGGAIFGRGEFYRIITSLFVHSGFTHLVSNISSLISIGDKSLRILGPKRLLTIYLVSGIVANYISYICNYAHKNGIPANLMHILTTSTKKLAIYRRFLVKASSSVIDNIIKTEKAKYLPLFLVDYIATSLVMTFDSVIAIVARLFEHTIENEIPAEMENSFKRFCGDKFRIAFSACGASSAIYGLYGAVLVNHLQYKRAQNLDNTWEILYSLIFPYIAKSAGQNIDHYSHISGFITGALLAKLMN
ncbi:conserved hypothetical protein [Theileria equi strain WA]|uniref:Peptidase S54 rhomboid domain-containing protein n=1 Tax=Theileria equi strain WA TaxID=1537102 RepID=L1LCT4_THEEQ|nr:conserved hypothetical protein [Theileria equi strain WA]EKX73151.1 conserved hypothetical protein [Theileria equi strain WA]|eukprot:XP_004832603.1 conserved hypothetical protein [Theileria equi strain WA]